MKQRRFTALWAGFLCLCLCSGCASIEAHSQAARSAARPTLFPGVRLSLEKMGRSIEMLGADSQGGAPLIVSCAIGLIDLAINVIDLAASLVYDTINLPRDLAALREASAPSIQSSTVTSNRESPR